MAVSPPPALPLADEGDEDTQKSGCFVFLFSFLALLLLSLFTHHVYIYIYICNYFLYSSFLRERES